MIKHLTHLLLACLLTAQITQAADSSDNTLQFDPEASLVQIEVTKTVYDYKIPWVIRNTQTRKNGIIIGEHQILTTADGLSGQYLCRMRKGGISHQYTATLTWVDYYANLAVFDVQEPAFWDGMQAIGLAKTLPQSGNLQIIRWRKGRIEERAAEIVRLYIGTNKMSYAQHLKLAVSSEIDAAGWAEVVVDQNEIVGLTSAASSNTLTILPAPFIRTVLEGKTQNPQKALGHFDFRWMSAKNPALLQSKGIDTPSAGVVITEVGSRRIAQHILKKGDVLLAINGFEIDNEGKYIDPEYGRLALNGIATRMYAAGDNIPMQIWRDGAPLQIDYPLPQAEFEKDVIPERSYDRAPEYLLAGGFLFQPLTGAYLDSLGKNSPITLDYYNRSTTIQRDGLVLLTAVLPDTFNRGYEDARMLIIDSINDQPISTLDDIEAAFTQSTDGFHRIQFMHDQGWQHIVLDSATMDAATQRILKHYNIPSARSGEAQ